MVTTFRAPTTWSPDLQALPVTTQEALEGEWLVLGVVSSDQNAKVAEAYGQMIQRAKQLEADAIVSVRFTPLGTGIIAYGTAVRRLSKPEPEETTG